MRVSVIFYKNFLCLKTYMNLVGRKKAWYLGNKLCAEVQNWWIFSISSQYIYPSVIQYIFIE